MALTCEIVADFAALSAHAADWERLLAAGDRQEIFDTVAWARAWWRVHGPNVGLVAAVVRDATRVVAIWPLVRDGSTLRFLGYIGSDYKDLLCEPGREAEAVTAAVDTLFRTPGWDQMLLDNVPQRSRLAPALDALPGGLRRHVESAVLTACPTVRLSGPDRDQILTDILKKESLRRHEKKLAKLGALTFRHIVERAEIERHLPRFFQQHVQRRAMTAHRSLFLEGSPKALYGALVAELDPGSSLRFGVVELDGRPVAYHFGFQYAGKFVWYKPTFDIDYWDCGPGEVLLAFLFRYVRDAGLCEFDFTIGDESFKSRFATHEEQNLQIRLFRPGARGAVRRTLHFAKERFKTGAPVLFDRMRAWGEQADAHGGTIAALRREMGARWRAAFDSSETLVYTLAAPVPGEVPSTRAEVESLTLGHLIDLAADNPELMAATDVGRARARLKAGDVAWCARVDGRVAFVAWAKRATSIGPLSAERRASLTLAVEAVVIDDCWVATGLEDDQIRLALKQITKASAANAEPHRVLCPASAATLGGALDRAGGKITARFRFRRIWNRVLDAVEAAAPDALG